MTPRQIKNLKECRDELFCLRTQSKVLTYEDVLRYSSKALGLINRVLEENEIKNKTMIKPG